MTNNNEDTILGLDEIEIKNTAVEDIDSEVVNLVYTGIDESGSMDPYRSDMVKALDQNFKAALVNSKEADEILIARASFGGYGIAVGGYKKPEEFDIGYKATGGTPMYDVIVQGADELMKYMDYLKNQGMRVKAVFSIFSDGDDTTSKLSASDAKRKIDELNGREIVTAFISFGSSAKAEAQRLGFKNILEVGVSASELRKAFNYLSKSVAENSKAVPQKVDNFFTI